MTSNVDFNLYGITVPQILAFFLTIAAAYFSARWASAESRKQFNRKTQDDERAAAAELIPLLMKLALKCDKQKGNLSLFMNSGGQRGRDEAMSNIEFDPKIHSAAARLGPGVTARAIKLEMTKFRAEEYVDDVAGDIDEDELNQEILSFLALLSLRARYLADMAAEKVGISMRHPQDDMDRLLKEGTKHSYLIDSGDEESWY
jgi:hypothetical protein